VAKRKNPSKVAGTHRKPRRRRQRRKVSASMDIAMQKQAAGRYFSTRAGSGSKFESSGDKKFGRFHVHFHFDDKYTRGVLTVMGLGRLGTRQYKTLAGVKNAYKAINSAKKAEAFMLRNLADLARRATKPLDRRWERPNLGQDNLHWNKLNRRLKALGKHDASMFLTDALQLIDDDFRKYIDGSHYVSALFSTARDAKSRREYEQRELIGAFDMVKGGRHTSTQVGKKLNAALDKIMKKRAQRSMAYGYHKKTRKNPMAKSKKAAPKAYSKKVGRWRVECKGRTVYAAGAKHTYATPAVACGGYKKITSNKAVEAFVMRYGKKGTKKIVTNTTRTAKKVKKVAPKRKAPAKRRTRLNPARRRNAPMSRSEASSVKAMLRKHGYLR
jgi:hypothetical protein